MTKMIIKVDNNDINWINSFNAYYDSTFTIGQEIEREDADQFQKMAYDFNNRIVDELDGQHYEIFVVQNSNNTQSTKTTNREVILPCN